MQDNISQALITDLTKRLKRKPVSKPLEASDINLKGFILRVQPSGGMS